MASPARLIRRLVLGNSETQMRSTLTWSAETRIQASKRPQGDDRHELKRIRMPSTSAYIPFLSLTSAAEPRISRAQAPRGRCHIRNIIGVGQPPVPPTRRYSMHGHRRRTRGNPDRSIDISPLLRRQKVKMKRATGIVSTLATRAASRYATSNKLVKKSNQESLT